MKRILNSPTPVVTPVGSPNQWYSPVNTPMGTPGSVYTSISPCSIQTTPTSPSSFGTAPTSPNSSHMAPASPSSSRTAQTSPSSHQSVQNPNTSGLQTPQGKPSSDCTTRITSGSVGADSLFDTAPGSVQSIGDQPCSAGPTNTSDSIESTTEVKKKFPFSKTQVFTLIILAFSGICSSMFGSLLAPFFPSEALKKGVSLTWIGILFGSYQLVGFIFSPILGAYLTRIGAKFMYVSGIFVNSSCAILFGTLQWCPPGVIYIVMCFSCRSLEALGSAAIGTANRAIATHTFPNHVSTVIGILNACSCIGLMVGPPIGGVLFELGGFFLPFAVTGSGFMFCGFLSWCLLPAPTGDDSAEVKSNIPKWHLLKLPVISVIGYVVFVGQFAMGFIDVTFTIHLQNVQPSLSQGYIGLIFLIAPVVVVMFAPIIGWIADKVQMLNRPIMLVGIVLAALGFMGLGPSPFLTFLPQYSLAVVLVSLAISGVGWAALVITYQEFVTAAKLHGFPDTLETQGLVSGVYNAYNNFGAFMGPICGGIMNEHLKFPWSSTVNAIMIGSSAVILLIYTLLEACCCPPSGDNQNYSADDTERLVGNHDSSHDDGSVIDRSSGVLVNEDSTTIVRDTDVYKDVQS